MAGREADPTGHQTERVLSDGSILVPNSVRSSNLLYYGLLVYTFLFYSQIAGRYPFLAPLRLELIVGAFMVVASLLSRVAGEKKSDNTFTYLAIGFLVYIAATIPVAYVKSRALDRLFDVLKYFAIYLMIVCGIETEKQLRGFVHFYVGMIALVFAEPFLHSLSGQGFVFNNHMIRLAGVTGYFAHPNQLGMITAIHLPFWYYLINTSDRILLKGTVALLGIISVRVIMLTLSRTAFMGLFTFFVVIWLTSRRKAFGLIGYSLLLAIVWVAAPTTTRDRFLTFRETGRVISDGRESFTDGDANKLGSMASRWELVLSTLETFRENPLLGVGLGCAGSYSGRKGGSWFPPHNTYLQILAEMGIVGSLLFLSIVYMTLRNIGEAQKLLRAMDQERSFLYSTLRALFAAYVILLVVATFGIEMYSNYWWLLGGLAVVILRMCRGLHADHNRCVATV